MNKIQKTILGWALFVLAALMIFSAAMNSGTVYSRMMGRWGFSMSRFLEHPLLYIGLCSAIAGVVVLAGIKREGKRKGQN